MQNYSLYTYKCGSLKAEEYSTKTFSCSLNSNAETICSNSIWIFFNIKLKSWSKNIWIMAHVFDPLYCTEGRTLRLCHNDIPWYKNLIDIWTKSDDMTQAHILLIQIPTLLATLWIQNRNWSTTYYISHHYTYFIVGHFHPFIREKVQLHWCWRDYCSNLTLLLINLLV